MSQARYRPIEAPGGASAVDSGPTQAMRTFCALRAQISPKHRVVVIPPGVSFDHYTPDPTVRAAVPTFAYVGRLKRYKGVDLVIRAFYLGSAEAKQTAALLRSTLKLREVFVGDGRSWRRGGRARSFRCADARERHDALRDSTFRIPGAHAARRQAGELGRFARRLR